ncbi:kelch repeatcontaining protein [Acanthamoeba castellanii str. Neff]|uniref:Kelch repeatcontaining protein n=1 Tax=Acanthamoeba castellanii (strain ATCC 30010 / Neff) TaxID=1257118 RepID=L8GPN9_ACACF|nr:kelch repeatcontaining protein [Acanthamoeba castellanii str. Neff]ELR14583.1 kelch repeatcontaining protein [Acanthamoeba castellanii str. Neff]
MVWKATKASGKSPFPASGHSITARDKQVYVFAGNTNKTTHANLFILNTGGLKTWTDGATRGQGPTERQDHSSTIIQNNNKDHLFIFGGKDKTHNYNEVFLLNADTLAWSRPRCTGTTPLPRSAHSAVPLGPNKILLFGGKYLSRPLNDLYLFVNERTKNDWSIIKTQGTPPSPRFSHAAAMWKHYMVVFGGSDGKNIYSDVHLLDTNTWTWTQPQVNGWIAPRTAFGAAIAENKLYVFGGQSAHGALNDLHYLDLGELTLSPQRQRQRFA